MTNADEKRERPNGYIAVLYFENGMLPLRYTYSKTKTGAEIDARAGDEDMTRIRIRPVKLTFLDEDSND